MKISFFGSSLVSAFWNGAATYYRGLIRELSKRGHSIDFYEPDAFERQQHRDMEDPKWAKIIVYTASEEGVLKALESARFSDVIIKASGVGVYDDLLEKEVLACRTSHNLIIYWDVDAPATLERISADTADPLRACLPRYDLILTYGGGAKVVQGFLSLGAKQCVPIYNALDPEIHFPVPGDPRFAADLVFLGNRLPDREVRVENFFLKPAEQLPNKDFMLGGNGWDDKQMPQNVQYLGHVYTRDHNALNSSCLSVLNINRDSMVRFGYSPPTRIFEAAGAGACIISDSWPGIEDFLEPGREILLANNGDDVADHLQKLNFEAAKCIGSAGRKRILAQHTYYHRATQVDDLLKANHH